MKQTTFIQAQVSDKKNYNVIQIKTKYALEHSDSQHQSTKVKPILNVSVVQEYSDAYIIQRIKSPLSGLLKSNSLSVV